MFVLDVEQKSEEPLETFTDPDAIVEDYEDSTDDEPLAEHPKRGKGNSSMTFNDCCKLCEIKVKMEAPQSEGMSYIRNRPFLTIYSSYYKL